MLRRAYGELVAPLLLFRQAAARTASHAFASTSTSTSTSSSAPSPIPLTTTTTKILDGRKMAHDWLNELSLLVRDIRLRLGRPPGLAVILVGDRPDSILYASRKQEASARVGISFSLHQLPNAATQSDLESLVDRLCNDNHVDGVLVQLPLPRHLHEDAIIERFNPQKDVDGFHPLNLGRLVMRGRTTALVPCTPRGCLEMLRRAHIAVHGKSCVVVGDSNIVGLPLALMLRDQGAASITVCHRSAAASENESVPRSPRRQQHVENHDEKNATNENDQSVALRRAQSNACLPVLPGPGVSPVQELPWMQHGFCHNLPDIVRTADILIVAVGSPHMVRASWLKPGAVVLDVGINAVPLDPAEAAKFDASYPPSSSSSSFVAQASAGLGGVEYRVVGDVAFDECMDVAGALSPVPGGVGPMTIAALLHNTVDACLERESTQSRSGG